MIRIIDYGSGNLRSVQKAFERHGVTAEITSDPNRVAESDRLVLPGVGAFSDAMAALRDRGLVEPIRRHIVADRPFLGICMGLQLLFETGWEGGRHDGLGVFAGDVSRFDCSNNLKVPHMGWNQVRWRKGSQVSQVVGGDAQQLEFFYFVHSYCVQPVDLSIVAAETDYGGTFCSAVSRGRLLATQFHPEKSQSIGMRLLKYFIQHV
ncbi:MAG: imidazole glycerol phosphate synthase subunit HisH [Pirellulales bacterium]|jgi:glutamine amidotransferase